MMSPSSRKQRGGLPCYTVGSWHFAFDFNGNSRSIASRDTTPLPAHLEATMHARVFFLVLFAAFAIGCARSGKAGVDAPTIEFLSDVPVEVENRNFLDLTVYLLQQGNRQRLGTITGSSTGTLLIPKKFLRGYAGDLRFMGDRVGSAEAIVSDAINIRPGEHVHWVIEKVGRYGTTSSIAVVQ